MISVRHGIALLLIGVVAPAAIAFVARPAVPVYAWSLPASFPTPKVPGNNPMTRQKVELGRWLFHDTRLSVNGSTACVTCHVQALAFTDGKATATGATNERLPRSSMSLVNAAYNSTFDWASTNVTTLEIQMLRPLFAQDPVEMGLDGAEEQVFELLRGDSRYPTLFAAAFPGDNDPVRWQNVVQAIASFVRTIVSADSRYDEYINGSANALNEPELRGLELFLSERLECFHCHGGFNFTDASTHDNVANPPKQFHNTGLYNIGGSGAYPDGNNGLHEITGQDRDRGRFRAPTLRNIALTHPYMHDGSIATLDSVLDHYAAGGRSIAEGKLAGDGRQHRAKSEFVTGFELSSAEREDLLAFLHALTDKSLVSSPQWSDPFAAGASHASDD